MLLFRHSRLLKELFSSSISTSHGGFFRLFNVLQHSTNLDEAPKPQFMVDFLINSLGFTRAAAVSASSKVTSLKSTQNPELVINVFKEYGLDKDQIGEIISSAPKILNCRPKKNLEPKIRVLREHGFSGSDLVDLMKANPNLLRIGLHTRIIPIIDSFRRFMSSDEEAIRAIKKTKWLFAKSTGFKTMSANVLQLQVRGLSDEQIAKFLIKYPWGVASNPKLFERHLLWITENLGIHGNSPMFVYAVFVLSRFRKSTIEKKFQLLRSYDWSEEEISTFGRTNPYTLAFSEAKIRDGLNFFMKELRYTPAYLAARPLLFTNSLENRVKPRYKILEILKENKLVGNKPNLTTLVSYSELKFLQFVKRFKNELPSLVETYMNSIKKMPSQKCNFSTCDLP